MAADAIEAAFTPFREEGRALLTDGAVGLDAHTHLGVDEDGQSLEREGLLAALDEVSPDARACTFPLHDPDRHPGYRRPNDRVLEWAGASGGRGGPPRPPPPPERPRARGARRERRADRPLLPPRPGRGPRRRGRALPRARGARHQAPSARAGVRVRAARGRRDL